MATINVQATCNCNCLLVLMLVGRVLYTTQEFGGTAIYVKLYDSFLVQYYWVMMVMA
nr:unnamed protein product [Callosobruchus analis]